MAQAGRKQPQPADFPTASARFAGLSDAVQAERQGSLELGHPQVVDLLHGGHGRYVALCQRTDSGWHERMLKQDLAAFAGAALSGLPDAYLSQNGFIGRNRRITSVRALTSCWLDVDYYNVPTLANLDPDTVLARIQTEHPWLPKPTAAFNSGRGIYLDWIFPTPLTRDQLPAWQAVQDAITGAFAEYGADWAARDASRVLRIVGTVNSKSDRIVQPIAIGPAIEFERFRCAVMDGIAEARRNAKSPDPTDSTNPTENTRRQASEAQRAQSIKPYDLAMARMNDYRTLAQLRGTPRLTDCRHRMLYAYAISCAWFASDPRAFIAEVEGFARDHFANPRKYIASRVGTILERFEHRHMPRIWNGKQVANRYRIRNDTIIRMLDITPSEMEHMQTLINHDERQRRREERRRAAGMQDRGDYLADAEQRRRVVMQLRQEGRKPREIADLTDLTKRRVNQIIREAQADMFADEPGAA